jgi:kynureninase
MREGVIELRAFTHGLMPRTVPAMMDRFVEDWQTLGVDAWNRVPDHWTTASGRSVGWWTLPEHLGDHFVAPLIGAPEGTCIMIPNAHWAMQAILSSPEVPDRGRRVVITDAEFPSVRHSLSNWASMAGYESTVVPATADGFLNEDALLAAIDEETCLVVISHVGFLTGERIPDPVIRRIAARATECGAFFAVDGYHATGSLAFSVLDLDVDLYFGGLLKEASGSSGNGFIYVRKGVQMSPRIAGWFADAAPFAFDPLPVANAEIRRRFLGGTTPIAPLYHAVEGVRILLSEGMEQVEHAISSLVDYSIGRAREAGLRLVSPADPARRSAMVILAVPSADRLVDYLKDRKIMTDSRQGRYLRMAPFVWNTRDELTRTWDAVEEAVRTGIYLDLAPKAADGPVT